jgi:hypothetical protein
MGVYRIMQGDRDSEEAIILCPRVCMKAHDGYRTNTKLFDGRSIGYWTSMECILH